MTNRDAMTNRYSRALAALLCFLAAPAAPAAAQSATPLPAPVLEGAVGWAGFTDEDVVHHGLAAGAARIYLSPRISVGPEVVYMRGPEHDRDVMVTGNLTVDLLAPRAQTRRATPFVLVGGGLFRHSDRFQRGTFTSTEGAVTLGLGARAWVSRRAYVAVDARLGWELHARAAVTFGVALRSD